MPTATKLYINSIMVAGLCVLTGCLLFERQLTDPGRYFGYLLLACLASTLKIKLPKLNGTMSLNFFFILIGVAELTISETVMLGSIAALIQSLWKPRKQPAAIQVLFNISTVAVGVAVSFAVSHALVRKANLLVLLVVAVCAYFVLNTGLISLVLSLTGGKTLSEVWRQCYLWSFPYYVAGAVIAGGIVFSNRTVGWKPAVLMLPMIYLVYSYYRMYLLELDDL